MQAVPVPPSRQAPPGAPRSSAADAGVDGACVAGRDGATGVAAAAEAAGAVAGGTGLALEQPATSAVAAINAAPARRQRAWNRTREVMAKPPEGWPGAAPGSDRIERRAICPALSLVR